MRRLLPCLLLLACAPVSARTLGGIEFTDCELSRPGTGATTRAECATLEVPEDPDAPQGRRISLRLALLPSRAAEPLPDPVVMLAGGPGQAATEAFGAMAGELSRLRERRHVLLMDQRGTGGSNRLACEFPDDLTAEAATPERQVAMARDCLQALDADAAMYTTSVAVRDLEALRIAVGAPAFNVYGGSYGTRVAQEYARQFPASVRTLVLDGVVPPALALGSEHAVNLEAALQSILGACAAQPACAEAFGDPYARLRELRDAARAAPRSVPLRDPLTNTPRELRLDGDTVAVVARLFAYAPESAALLPLLVDEAAKGRPEPLLAQAALVVDSLVGQINHGMQLSVACAEDLPGLQPRPQDADLMLGTAMIEVLRNQCSVWPAGPVSPDFREPLRSEIPTLLLSGELDPVTPPRYAKQVLEGLSNARHLVGKGQGHILLNRGCTMRLVGEFIGSRDPKALDAACLDSLGAAPFFTTFNGAEP